jgi:hypothetical protein
MKLNVGPGTNIHRIAEQALQLLHLPPSDADDTVSFTFNDTEVVVTYDDESANEVVARYVAARRKTQKYTEA